jgi:ubiquinone/menaquinone biosynthesis C-methylase UbiE
MKQVVVDYVSKTISVYNAIADSYTKQAAHRGPVKQRKEFCSLLSKGGRIIDVGCGSGRDSEYFVQQGFTVTGVDLSEQLLTIAKKTVPKATFIKEDIRHLSLPINYFDGVWACASLLHIRHEEVVSTLVSWNTLLKTNGILYIAVKYGDGEVERIDKSVPGIPRLFSLFTKERITDVCQKAGFTVFSTYEYLGSHDVRWVDCWAKKI